MSNHNTTDKNANLLFLTSCIALTVTAMTFAIRAGILGDLGHQFALSNQQLGWINGMAFFGFPVATISGGLLYNYMGPKKMMILAFVGHLIGLGLTIAANGFWLLLISSFCVGFANGAVEAACNPLVANLHPNNRTTMLNRFHVWFPGGIVIGAIISAFATSAGISWQMQIAVMLVPTLVYGWLIFTLQFPEQNNIETSTATNIKGLVNPLYWLLLICMTLTATAELGTQQWINQILGASGASPMLVLALVTGIMAVGRFFAGPIVHRLNPVGVLWASSAIACIAIFLMSMAAGIWVYACAVLFAFGVTYFWPTMIGVTSEKFPETGALGMSVIGGVGMFGLTLWNPVIGKWIDDAKTHAATSMSDPALIELAAGQATLQKLALFPLVLILLFGIFKVFSDRQSAE